MRDFYLRLQRLQPQTQIVDITTWKDWEARDLRGMGETNAVIGRRKSFSRRRTLMRACEIYVSDHADETGRVPATFELITLTGWAPAKSQPKSAPRGSGQVPLIQVLGASDDPPKPE